MTPNTANGEIVLLPASRRHWKGAILGLFLGAAALSILIAGNITVPAPSRISWAWGLLPLGWMACTFWEFRKHSSNPIRIMFGASTLELSAGREVAIPLCSVRHVEVRRDPLDRLLGLARLRIVHSGRRRVEIAGRIPSEAERACAEILSRRGPEYLEGLGQKLSRAEWKAEVESGKWVTVQGKKEGWFWWVVLSLWSPFPFAFALLMAVSVGFVLWEMTLGGEPAHAVLNQRSPATFWDYFVLYPAVSLFAILMVLWSARLFLEVLADWLMPSTRFRGKVERRYTTQGRRTTLHYFGSGPWDWQVTGGENYRRMNPGREFLVRFHPHTGEVVELLMRE